MAQRKKLQTETTGVSYSESRRNDPALPEAAFNTVIRAIKQHDIRTAEFLFAAARERMQELGISQRGGKAVKGTPEGSDNISTGSIVTWMKRITKTDKAAVAQLKSLRATAHSRINA